MLKRLGRSRAVQNAVGFVVAGWFRLVERTTRFVCEPEGFRDSMTDEYPFIVALWHGQHFMVHYAWFKDAKVAALISRSGDGELNANIARRFGVEPIRGSGGKGDKIRKRGGSAALREMLRRLADGWTIATTADVPKVSRVAGEGIVVLAQMSGRPIYPLAVVTKFRKDFRSWDRASLGLPFGRGAMVLGDPIRVPKEADAQAREDARQAVEAGLNAVHARAYALVGSKDPGARGDAA